MKTVYLFSLILLVSSGLKAQEYDWWVKIHDWDGYSHWTTYLIMSPNYFGPNAIPVSGTKTGIIGDKPYFLISSDFHGGRGDNTQNAYTEFYYPFADGKIGISISVVPFEHYKMDTTIRDERRLRDYDGTGYAFGDVYFGTLIQFVKNKKYFPDIVFSFNLKTASGGNLAGGRYTDTPGYFFDLSFGKTLKTGIDDFSLRLYSTIGFYCWQTNRTDNYQNDAYIYSGGLDLNYKDIKFSNSIDGFSGYMENGDCPQLYRSTVGFVKETHEISLMYQYGIRDFPYTSVRIIFKKYFK